MFPSTHTMPARVMTALGHRAASHEIFECVQAPLKSLLMQKTETEQCRDWTCWTFLSQKLPIKLYSMTFLWQTLNHYIEKPEQNAVAFL